MLGIGGNISNPTPRCSSPQIYQIHNSDGFSLVSITLTRLLAHIIEAPEDVRLHGSIER